MFKNKGLQYVLRFTEIYKSIRSSPFTAITPVRIRLGTHLKLILVSNANFLDRRSINNKGRIFNGLTFL